MLLGAVVEVALDLAAGGVRGGDDAGPGLLELLGLLAQLLERLLQGRVELDVVQGQAYLAGQLGQHRVVVGGELVAAWRPDGHDQPEHAARVGRRRHPHQGPLPPCDHPGHPHAEPGRAGHAGPGHHRLLFGLSAKLPRWGRRARDRALETSVAHPSRPRRC